MDFHSMKRKELQALCKKHKIPANLTNLEMANRLTSLLKGKDKFFNGRRSCLKSLDENGKENESDVENKRVKKVRFTPENQMIEFQKLEAKVSEIERRGRRKWVINEANIVENVGGPELCEGIGHVTRSRGRRLVKEGKAERKGGKRGVKDDALGTKLPSTVDNEPSVDVKNEEGRVVTRRSRRNREVVDEKNGKNEDAEKGLKNNRMQRNLRQGNVKCRDDVAERVESVVECVEVQEKVLRRSKRNLTTLEDDKLLSVCVSNEMIATLKSIKTVTKPASEGSDPSGVDIDDRMLEKEDSPGGMGLRRSRRNTSSHEPVITLGDLVADSNYQRQTRKKRKEPILEHGSVEIDSKTIGMSLRRSSRNANRSEKAAPSIISGKLAQKEKRRSKKQNEEIEDSFPEDLTTEGLPDVDVQPFLTEVAKSAICPDLDNEGFVDNVKSQRQKHRKNSCRKSQSKVHYSLVGVNSELSASESSELKNDDIKTETETSPCQIKVVAQDANIAKEVKKKSAEYHVPDSYSDEPAAHFHNGTTFLSCSAFAEQECVKASSVGGDVISSEELSVADSCLPIDQSDSRDPKDIQLWVALSAGLKTICDDEFEKCGNTSFIGPCETDRLASCIRDNAYEANPVNTEDFMTTIISGHDKLTNIAESNNNDDRTSTLHLGRTLEQRDPLLSIQRNGCQVDNVAEGDRNFDLEELKCTKSTKSGKDKSLEENYDAPDKCCESCIPEPSRSVISRMLENGNINGGEDPSKPAGKHLVSPSIAAKAVETTRIQTESSAGISSLGSTTTPLEFNSTLEDPELGGVSNTTYKDGHSLFQDTNVQEEENLEKSVDEMDLEKHLELRMQSPSMRSDDVAEEEKYFEDVKSCVELPKSEEEDNTFYKFGQSNAFDPSGCKLGMLGDPDANVGNDFADDADSQRLVLAAQDFVAQTIEGSKKCYEDEPGEGRIADCIETCVREECISAKKDGNYEEDPVNSEVYMAAMTSGTGNIPYIPTGNYKEEPTTSAMKMDTTLEQKYQSPILQMYGSEADNVAVDNRGHYRVEVNYSELTQSVEDRQLEEQYYFPNMFQESSASNPYRSTRRMLQDEIANGGEDSTKGQKNTAGSKEIYEDEPEKDGIADFIESCAREECISAKKDGNYEVDPVNTHVSMAAMTSGTGNIPYIPTGNYIEEPTTSSMRLDTTLEQKEQSQILQMYSEADNVAEEDRGHYLEELNSNELAQSVEDRHFEEQYNFPTMFQESSVSDPSRSARIMQQGETANGGEDSTKDQKNTASSKKIYEDEPKNDGDAGFVESCVREECTSAKKDKNCEENHVNFEDAMATMKYRTGNSPCVSVLHNNEESTSSMNLDIKLETREQLQIAHSNGYEANRVVEVDMQYDQVELKSDEFSKYLEHTPLEEQYHSPNKHWESSISDSSPRSARSKLQDVIFNSCEDSVKLQKNATGSSKSYEDGPRAFTDACMTKKCISAKNDDNSEEASVNSEDPMEAVICRTGDFAHISLVDNNEHTASKSSDMALEQQLQSPILQMNACDADSAAEDKGDDLVELYCDELAEYLEDRCLEEQNHSLDKCLGSSVSDSSRIGRMLQDEIVRGGEDSIKHQKKSYENAPEEDGNAGSVKSSVIDKYTAAKNFEDDPVNSKDTMEAVISGTDNFADIPVADSNEECNSTMDIGILLEQREQSPILQKNCCETDNSAEEDLYFEDKELNCDELAKSVEDRSFKEQYHSPDKCSEQIALDPFRRIFQDEIVNGDEDSSPSADLLGTSIGSTSVAAKTVERNSPGIDIKSSTSNIGSINAFDLNPTLDGPEEITDVVEQSSTVQKNSVGADHVAEAHISFEEIKNHVELANFEEEDRKKEDSDGIIENISGFECTELSETKFTLNSQEKLSCKEKEDNGKDERENLAAIFSQLIHSEERILEDIQDNVASKLCKHHEILEESSVADTINDTIHSESTRNLSPRMEYTSDILHIDVMTKVAKQEAEKAEETIDTTGRKFELSVEEDDQEKGEATDLAETALGSAWISERKTTTLQRENANVVANENSSPGKQFKSEMGKNIRTILIHGTPKKLKMTADMKENVPSSKMENFGCLTTMKPATKRPALKDLRQ